MALLQVNFFSNALRRVSTLQVLLPNDVPDYVTSGNKHYERQTKTLYLLHGYSGNTVDWILGSQAQEMSIKYNLAIVMPSGENSFYLDGKGTGRAYGTFTGSEIVNYMRKTFGLSDKKEDTFIGGLSMGGFGAIHTGVAYPENFGKMFGLSSALIIHNIKGKKEDFQNDVADYDYYTITFGDLDKLEESDNNPEYLIKKRKANGETIQPIFMACGTEDFLLNENRAFYEFLKAEQVEVTYKESSGVHDWKFWSEYLEIAIKWLVEE